VTAHVRRTAKGHAEATLALALGASAAQAAARAGVHERTVRRWLADVEFVGEVGAIRRDVIDRAVGELVGSATTAVRVLRELAQDGESEAVRSRSADRLLRHLCELTQFSEAETRLADLEAIASAGHPLHVVRGGRA
jgi:hypothetical protein